MSRSVAAVVVAMSLPLLAGCAGLGVTNSPSSSSPDMSSLTPPAADPAASPAPTSPAAPSAASSSPSSLTKKFGSTFTWDDGVALTIGNPTPFTPSQTAFPSKPGVVMDVTVKNESQEPVNPFMISMQATSGEQQAEQIFDTENSVGAPTASVLPGRSLKFKVAFTKPSNDFTLQVDYGFGNAQGFYQ